MLTAGRVRELLRYEPETGDFVCLVRRGGRLVGDIAGTPGLDGHIQIQIDNKIYQAGRLAWLWMTGEWPPNMVDHIDNIGTNNRWANLRLATRSQNLHNRGKTRRNTTGFKGVWRSKQGFVADISAGKKRTRLGVFATAEAAHEAYCKAAEKLHGKFARVA